MKPILNVFLCLLAVFFICWGVKARALPERPKDLNDNLNAPKWFEGTYTSPTDTSFNFRGTDIPENYIPVMGEEDTFYEVDDNGNVIKKRKRIRQADGSYKWTTVEEKAPTMKLVNKDKKVYEVKDPKTKKKKYVKYIRNKNGTATFVETDKNGNYKNFEEDATKVDDKHVLEDSSKNLYGLYNDDKVRIGTVKRVKGKDGKLKWQLVDAPEPSLIGNDGVHANTGNGASLSEGLSGDSEPAGVVITSMESEDGPGAKTPGEDGTYTETKTETITETKDGYRYQYQQKVTMTYDKDGNLIASKSSDPEVVGKERIQTADIPDESAIASNLDDEYVRMSAKVEFNTSKATKILSKLNALRQQNGVPVFNMDTSSDIYKIACIRAADMAVYNHSSNKSPLYGNTSDLCNRFGVNLVNVTQNMYSTSEASADSISTKLQAVDTTRETRMNEAYGQVGIAVVDKNGMTYIIEVFAQ